MKRLLPALLLAFALLLFSGCRARTAPEPDSIVGTWKDSYGLTEYKFNDDGTMKIEALNLGSFKGTYRVDGAKLTVEYRVVVKDVKDTFDFRLDGDTLYLNDKEFRRGT